MPAIADAEPKAVDPVTYEARLNAIRTHDLLNVAADIAARGALLSLQSPEHAEYGKGIENAAHRLADLLRSNSKNAPSPRTIGEFRDMLADMVAEMRLPDGMRADVGECPQGMHAEGVPVSEALWLCVLQNLIANAGRKGAKNVVIAFGDGVIRDSQFQRGMNVRALRVAVQDDGEGMPPEVLDRFKERLDDRRPFDHYTDKTPGDGIAPGETAQDHGHGMQSVREVVEKVSLGAMEIDSRRATEQEPDAHGTTIGLLLPILNEEQKASPVMPAAPTAHDEFRRGDTPPEPIPAVQPTAPEAPRAAPRSPEARGRLSSLQKWTRYAAAAVLVVGGGAATWLAAAGTGGRERDSERIIARERPSSPPPLSAVTLDADGAIASFAITVEDRTFRYAQGGMPEGFVLAQALPIDGGSLVSFAVEKNTVETGPMFLCSVREGVFGQIDVPAGGIRKSAFVCMRRGPDGTLLPPRLFPLNDSVVSGPHVVATSADLLRSAEFDAMADALATKVAPLVKRRQHAGNPGPLLVRRVVETHKQWKTAGVVASTREEWDAHARAANRFIVAEPAAVEHLFARRLKPADTKAFLAAGNRACLVGAHPQQASMLLPVE